MGDIKWRRLSNAAIPQYFLITAISVFAISRLILAFSWMDGAVTWGTGISGLIFGVDK